MELILTISITMKRHLEEDWREQEILQINQLTENGMSLRRMILMVLTINLFHMHIYVTK